jgi:L-iditol 2-dehydrogenase
MQALLLPRYGHLEIIDMPVPVPAAGEILVRVRACGICGSDVHGLDGSTGRRIPPLVMKPPVRWPRLAPASPTLHPATG